MALKKELNLLETQLNHLKKDTFKTKKEAIASRKPIALAEVW